MELSRFIGKAQTPDVCQFCNENPEIKWKCIDCELFLCQQCCSQIHMKCKASNEHAIIDLKDADTEDFAKIMREVDIQNMQCPIHGRQRCFIYCKDCSVPACSKCIIKAHQKHEFKAIVEVYEGLLADIKEVENKLESTSQILRTEKKKLQNMLFDGDKKFQETKDFILKSAIELKDAISKYAQDLIDELDVKWKTTEKNIKKELLDITKNEKELETRYNLIKRVMQSHHVTDIFTSCKTLDKSLPKYSFKNIKQCETKFIPNKRYAKKGSQMLGNLYEIQDFELIDTYQSDNINVTNLLLHDDKTAFIGSFSSPKLQKIKLDNNEIRVEKEIQMAACDMALRKDGDLLISSTEGDIKLYTKDGKLKPLMSFSPLKTLGIHVTKDNNIIVGLSESIPVTVPPPIVSIRKLIVINQHGDIQHTIEFDRNNKKILSFPRRIKTLNEMIVVVDVMNTEREGRVVMLDYGGQLHWTYNGCRVINSDKYKYYPRGLAITSTDLLLVSDSFNHSIDVLNSAGEVIVCKDVKSLGMKSPLSLDIDKNEVLWIGCSTWEKDKIKNVKINCVKLI